MSVHLYLFHSFLFLFLLSIFFFSHISVFGNRPMLQALFPHSFFFSVNYFLRGFFFFYVYFSITYL
ncbi:hypothetical protein EDC96DRAFT_526206, partial [Choanephora cucurbitarum]